MGAYRRRGLRKHEKAEVRADEGVDVDVGV